MQERSDPGAIEIIWFERDNLALQEGRTGRTRRLTQRSEGSFEAQ